MVVGKGLMSSRFHRRAIDRVKSRRQLEGFHFTCLFYYSGDLHGEDLRNWRHKIETDNKSRCLHALIIGYGRNHRSKIEHFSGSSRRGPCSLLQTLED